jgi:predicted dehydrogenase
MTVRIGLLGAARIAPKAVLWPAAARDDVEVVAVAARDRSRGEAFAAEHGIPRVHDDYAALVADDELDLVYLPLPISEHAPWAIRALESGRHVLCEKPLALNVAESRSMVDAAAAADRLLVEAMHWRYHPQVGLIDQLVEEIGEVTEVQARLDSPIEPGDIRYQLALGGGSLMDLGCYPVGWLQHVAGPGLEVLDAEMVVGPPGVDLAASARLRLPSGGTATIGCDMRPGVTGGLPVIAFLTVRGAGGWFTVTNPQSVQYGSTIRGDVGGRVLDLTAAPDPTTYAYQFDAVVDAVGGGPRPPTEASCTLGILESIESIYAAAGLAPRGRE